MLSLINNSWILLLFLHVSASVDRSAAGTDMPTFPGCPRADHQEPPARECHDLHGMVRPHKQASEQPCGTAAKGPAKELAQQAAAAGEL